MHLWIEPSLTSNKSDDSTSIPAAVCLSLTAVVFHHSLRKNPVCLMFDRPLLFACRRWKPGQPDDWGHGHEMGEDCAGLIHEGLWNDFFCEDLISYICEKEMDTSTSVFIFFSFPNVQKSSCPNICLDLFLQRVCLNRSDFLEGSLQ